MVLGNLSANVTNAQRILRSVARKIPMDRSANTCSCPSALETAILTDHSKIPANVKEKYALLIGKYLAWRSLLTLKCSRLLGASLTIIANVSPDVQSQKDQQDYNYDHFKTTENGGKYRQVISHYRTHIRQQ